MKFTFGIITRNDVNAIKKQIASIEKQGIPEYEIIVVGANEDIPGARVIPFDETQKPKWITRKKNIITEEAKYDNIVQMLDYIVLEDGWYEGWLKFGDDFKVAINKVIDHRGNRYRDWITQENFGRGGNLLPYDVDNASQIMYINGLYWVAKKHVMEEFPLNENLCWAEGEDMEWSHRIRYTYPFTMNPNCTIKLFRNKPNKARLVDKTISDKIRNMTQEELKSLSLKHYNDRLPLWIQRKANETPNNLPK